MRKLMALGGVLATLTASAAVLATPTAALAAPAATSVDVVTANGSGCPNATESASAELSANRRWLTTTVPTITAWDNDEASPLLRRKNCQIAVGLIAPEGWTYAVSAVRASGGVAVSEGSTAVVTTRLYFQGLSQTPILSRTIEGPTARDWSSRDRVGEVLNYAPCGEKRYLNINTEVRANAAPGGFAFLARNPETELRLVWRRCA